jgi:hypothetical protein
MRESGNPKMWRGNAVEAGFAAYLRKGNLEEAQAVAECAYLNALEFNAYSTAWLTDDR